MFRSGVPAVKPASDAFSMFDGARQAEQTDGLEFVDQTFEVQERRSISVSWRKTLLWRSEERCDEPSNTSVFSGVSDRSIILRNSNLREGNTSQVNLVQLMAENNLMTKMSRPGVSISETFPALWVVWMKAKLKATDQDLALFTLSDYQREGETIYSRVAVVLMAKDSWRETFSLV